MKSELCAASKAYREGHTCSQAVFCAYAGEMGLDRQTACRIMEGFGGGMGGMQEVCGAMVAAFAVISYRCGGCSRTQTYARIRQAAALFRREYGGLTCREILNGDTPNASLCAMKVKDAILIVEQIAKGESL